MITLISTKVEMAHAVQNQSHAVMSQRHEHFKSLDDFPTPPWATRALIKHVLFDYNLNEMTCSEPACGRGYMSDVLEKYFKTVESSDVADYGYGAVYNFFDAPKSNKVDWVITNPPFNQAEDFVAKALEEVNVGVAVLVRTMFLESVGRFHRLFSQKPPTTVAQFTERVPIVKGRIDPSATSATGYAWVVWDVLENEATKLVWIPPCRKSLEIVTDYQAPIKSDQISKGSPDLFEYDAESGKEPSESTTYALGIEA